MYVVNENSTLPANSGTPIDQRKFFHASQCMRSRARSAWNASHLFCPAQCCDPQLPPFQGAAHSASCNCHHSATHLHGRAAILQKSRLAADKSLLVCNRLTEIGTHQSIRLSEPRLYQSGPKKIFPRHNDSDQNSRRDDGACYSVRNCWLLQAVLCLCCPPHTQPEPI